MLNVDFGVPLFDSQLNRDVCDRITSHQLWQREKLDALKKFQSSLSERLIEFIKHHTDTDSCAEWPVQAKAGTDVALPTRPLLFAGGKLVNWDEH